MSGGARVVGGYPAVMTKEERKPLLSHEEEKTATKMSLAASAADPAGDDKKAAAVDALKQRKGGATELSNDEIVKRVSEALGAKLRSEASEHNALLAESGSISAVLQFPFMWRKPPSAKEVLEKQRAAKAANTTYVPDTSIAGAPVAIKFDAETLNQAFGGKINFAKPQYLLSAYIEEAYTSAPYPLNFTLRGVNGKTLSRVTANDGTTSSVTLFPNTTLTKERQLHRMGDVNADNLYAWGNVDMQAEFDALLPAPEHHAYLASGSRLLGKLIAANKDKLGKDKLVEYFRKGDLWLVGEDVVGEMMSKFHAQVLSDLETTDFTAIEGVLTRDVDRAPDSTADFADATDAPGISSKVAAEAAHKATHLALVNVRLHVIDPAKLRKPE
jgi:hypothetical protein